MRTRVVRGSEGQGRGGFGGWSRVPRWGKGDPRGSIPPPVERLHSVRTADVLVFRLEIKCRLVQTGLRRLFPNESIARDLIFWYIEYIYS